MNILNTFLDLLARTEGRDKALRLVQYATLNGSLTEGATKNVYQQIRRTRKVLRFLRTLEFSSVVRKECLSLQLRNKYLFARKVLVILQNIGTIMFYFSDHRVILSDLGLLSKECKTLHYPRSMKWYLFQNIIAVLRNIVDISLIVFQGQLDGQILDMESGGQLIKSKAFDLIRSILDCLIALYYLRDTLGPKAAGVIGVITSIMAIIQSIKLI